MIMQKSRRRDDRAVDFGGYMLIDAGSNSVIMGGDPYPYSATIEQVESWLDEPKR